MDEKHRNAIDVNMSALVEETNLEILLPVLREKGVISDMMMESIVDASKTDRARKLSLYLLLKRRGPNAFDELIRALQETGHWNLVKQLSPDHELNNFISISQSKKLHKTTGILHPAGNTLPIPTSSSVSNNTNKEIYSDLDDYELGEINVIKSTKISESLNPEIMCYSMKSKRRGVLFMINNIQFMDNVEEYREGAMKDQENLRQLFKQIGFHQIIIHNNKSKVEMESLLWNLRESSVLERSDCVFIVIASHGMANGYNNTSIIASDGDHISSDSILEIFNNKNCPLLHNIPKVFIFQVCRGNSPDFGIRTEAKTKSLNNRTQVDVKAQGVAMRTYSDMLIAHSTVPGFSSHRDTLLGSWYMLSLCKIFMSHAHNTHLEDLFRLVDSHLKDIKLQRNSLQTSSVENRGFNKYCYLNPGYFET